MAQYYPAGPQTLPVYVLPQDHQLFQDQQNFETQRSPTLQYQPTTFYQTQPGPPQNYSLNEGGVYAAQLPQTDDLELASECCEGCCGQDPCCNHCCNGSCQHCSLCCTSCCSKPCSTKCAPGRWILVMLLVFQCALFINAISYAGWVYHASSLTGALCSIAAFECLLLGYLVHLPHYKEWASSPAVSNPANRKYLAVLVCLLVLSIAQFSLPIIFTQTLWGWMGDSGDFTLLWFLNYLLTPVQFILLCLVPTALNRSCVCHNTHSYIIVPPSLE